ncbi:MAG: hypothetical protein AABY86_03405 [Bdellovibrionota bacterium]
MDYEIVIINKWMRTTTVIGCMLWGFVIFSFAMAQVPDSDPTPNPNPVSGSSSMMGVKIEDSEDLNDDAKSELEGSGGSHVENASDEHQPMIPEEKPDIVIIRPPTLEEQARIVREEIEMEKAKKMLIKNGRPVNKKVVSDVGQNSDADNVGATNGGGGGGDGGVGHEEATWSIIKPTCLKERAEMEMAEVLMAKQKVKSPGQGGGVGGGSGEGSGSGSGNETGVTASSQRTVKKVCKSKNMYECMAQEAKEREFRERTTPALVMENGENGGDEGTIDGSSAEAEVKFKRPPVRFKTTHELEAEAQKILHESDTPNVGEHIVESDQVMPVSTVTVTRPTIEENVRQVQSEIEADKLSRETGSGGEVKLPPTQDLE